MHENTHFALFTSIDTAPPHIYGTVCGCFVCKQNMQQQELLLSSSFSITFTSTFSLLIIILLQHPQISSITLFSLLPTSSSLSLPLSPITALPSSSLQKPPWTALSLSLCFPSQPLCHPGIYGGKQRAGVGHEAGEWGRRRWWRREDCLLL